MSEPAAAGEATLSEELRGRLANRVLDSIAEGIAVSRWVRDSEARSRSVIVMANPGIERLLGQPQDRLLGRDASEIYMPGELDRVSGRIRESIRAAQGDEPSECEPMRCQLRRSDGTPVRVTVSYRTYVDHEVDPPAKYVIGLARDTSASEQRDELLSHMEIAYFRSDADGMTEESNSVDLQITGYSKDELRGLSRSQLHVDPERRDRLLDDLRRNQGRLMRKIMQLRRKGGELFWAEGDLRIVLDGQGREAGIEGFYRDVSDRVRLQGFLGAEADPLLPEDELFSRLVEEADFHLHYLTSIGHQIQAPLGALVGTLQNFDEGLIGSDRLRERLPYLIGQARVCSRLVRNLTYLDKILRGERLEREPCPLARLAIETKLDFSRQLEARKLRLHIDDRSLDRHLKVFGHRELLRQVLVNLIDNATKYSVGGSRIRLQAHHWPAGRVLELESRGLPIGADNLERIFLRGVRTEHARRAVPAGTGFGLWLVRKIVEAHGASICCLEEREGNTSRVVFRIVFPHEQVKRIGRVA